MFKRRWPLSVAHPRLARSTTGLPRTRLRLIIAIEGVLLMLGLWASLTLRLPSDYGVLEVGKPSPFSIQAPRSAEFISEVRTAELQAQAEARPENRVFTTDDTIPRQQRLQLEDLLTTLSNVRSDPTLNDADKTQRINTILRASVEQPDSLAQSLVAFDDQAWQRVNEQSLALYDQAMAANEYSLDEAAVSRLRELSLPYWTSTRALTPPQRDLVLALTTSALRVNRTLDATATQLRQQQAREQVKPELVQVQEGESIVRVGEIVRQETIEKLVATGALPQSLSWLGIGGRGLLAALLALSFMLYLFFFHQEIFWQPRPLLVIVMIIVVATLVARLLLPIWPDWQYAFPLATVALVLTVVFNGRLALAGLVLLSLVIGVIEPDGLELMVTLLISSAVAVFTVRGTDRMRTFLLAGFNVAVVVAVGQLAFWLVAMNVLRPGDIFARLLLILLLSGINGALSSILALGLFNLVGQAAGVITPLQLMELAHPTQPLLRKLIQEAPGTYYHSVAVGNLAEAAAEAVGADALLLRVAAYYHDIGKTIRPYFFTDNQMGRENVHNELDPRTSAQIIVDHVREGLKMAKATRLPQPISDFIATHHGTGLIKHFYQMALQQEDTVNVEDFRYPGPRPSTREQGILMLADSVEATVRAKAQHGKLLPTRSADNVRANGGALTIEELVTSIIDERVREGQLDDTPLTLRDLMLIRQTFITNLQSIYHPRVDYAPQVVK